MRTKILIGVINPPLSSFSPVSFHTDRTLERSRRSFRSDQAWMASKVSGKEEGITLRVLSSLFLREALAFSFSSLPALYSSTRVPLLVLLKKPGMFNVDEYTCQNAETRQEVFQAMSTSTFGLTWTVRFANLAGNGETIPVKFNVDSVSS